MTPQLRALRPFVVALAVLALLSARSPATSAVASAYSLPAPDVAEALHAPELRPLRRSTEATSAPALKVSVDGEALRFGVSAIPVLPGAEVRIEAPEASGALLSYQAGSVVDQVAEGWSWRAPSRPGAYALRIRGAAGEVDLTALVVHPAASVRDGALKGYRIGEYARTPLRGNPAYLPPEGFVEVGSGDADLLVSPRLTLGQFRCKQPGEPRFIALSQPLVVKLEAILDEVERSGWDPASLVVMSAFRTPAYNRAIGNTTTYSRHLWGDAADIYLDGDGDGVMDDLNGDGRSDRGDAAALAALVERVVARDSTVRPGGLATYRANAVHGPFVHVDARGHRARW